MLSQLNQRAALQAAVPDGVGTITWQTFALVWVKLTPAGASDSFGPDVREARARYRITLRRRWDLAAGQRLAIAARSFAVHGLIDEGPQQPFVTLLCEELP
jgi:head-tail adaptor